MITAAALASVLLLAIAPSGPSGAIDGAPRHTPSVVLELGRLEPIDPGVRAELAAVIHAAISDIVRSRGVAPETIHIAIAWRDQDDVDYAVRIRVDAHAGVAARELTASTGPDATRDGLADVVAAGLARTLDERPRTVTPDPPPPPIVAPIVVSRPPAMKKDRRLGKLGWSGIGLAIAGTATLVGGVGLLALDRTLDPVDATRLRDWRPAGGSLVAVGGLALVAGVTMAIVDKHPRRRVAFAPFVPKRGLGLALRVRM